MKRGGVSQERMGDAKKRRGSYTKVTQTCSQVPDYVARLL